MENTIGSRGIILIGTGDWAPVAAIAALSFRYQNPLIPIVIYTSKRFGLNSIQEILTENKSRDLKTKLNSLSPWDHTLYVDADCLCLSPIGDDLFGMELGLVPEPLPSVEHCRHIKGEEYDYTLWHYKSAVMFNGGLIAWRTDAGNILFPEWRREWERFGGYDQLALARAIANLKNRNADLLITNLPWKFNFPIHSYSRKAIALGDAVILHCHTSRLGVPAWFTAAQRLAPLAYAQAIDAGVIGE